MLIKKVKLMCGIFKNGTIFVLESIRIAKLETINLNRQNEK